MNGKVNMSQMSMVRRQLSFLIMDPPQQMRVLPWISRIVHRILCKQTFWDLQLHSSRVSGKPYFLRPLPGTRYFLPDLSASSHL